MTENPPCEGKVEGLVGYARRNFLVPVPRVESLAALNAQLEARCRERQGARLRGHEETIATVQLDFNQPERFDLTEVTPVG